MAKIKVSIVFGEYATAAYERKFDGGETIDKNDKAEIKSNLIEREFDTDKEAEAYIQGVEDASGYLEHTVIPEEHAKTIKKFKV